MRVECPHCGVVGNLPDTKVPPGGSKITCPKCKAAFFVQRPEERPAEQAHGTPDPSSAADYLQDGVRLFKQRQLDTAIERFKLAIQVNPNEADAYRYLGAAYGQKNLWDEASQMLQSALRYQPDDVQLLKNLGVAYLKQNLFAQAEQAFRQASHFAPNDDKVASYLSLLAQKQGGAAPVAAKPPSPPTPQSAPESPVSEPVAPAPSSAPEPPGKTPARLLDPRRELLDKGVEYLDNGQINNAIEAFKEVIRLDEAKPEGHIGMAMVHEKRKEWGKALEAYEKALELDPNDTSAKEGIKFLKKQQKKFNWMFWKS